MELAPRPPPQPLSVCHWVLVSSVKLRQRLWFTLSHTAELHIQCCTPVHTMHPLLQREREREDGHLLMGRESKAALGTLGETV